MALVPELPQGALHGRLAARRRARLGAADLHTEYHSNLEYADLRVGNEAVSSDFGIEVLEERHLFQLREVGTGTHGVIAAQTREQLCDPRLLA